MYLIFFFLHSFLFFQFCQSIYLAIYLWDVMGLVGRQCSFRVAFSPTCLQSRQNPLQHPVDGSSFSVFFFFFFKSFQNPLAGWYKHICRSCSAPMPHVWHPCFTYSHIFLGTEPRIPLNLPFFFNIALPILPLLFIPVSSWDHQSRHQTYCDFSTKSPPHLSPHNLLQYCSW